MNPNIPFDNGTTPLYIASKNGYLRIVKQLLKARDDPDLSDSSGQAPLHHACLNSFLPIVQGLLQENADPNSATDDGVTPLHFACQISHLPVVEELLQKQADPNFKKKMEQHHCILLAITISYQSLTNFFRKKQILMLK